MDCYITVPTFHYSALLFKMGIWQVMVERSDRMWSTGKREWQTTSVFLLWEPHEQYERQNERTLREDLPRSVGAQYATGDQWRNNSRKDEGMEPKQKQQPVVDVTDDKARSDAEKSNIE